MNEAVLASGAPSALAYSPTLRFNSSDVQFARCALTGDVEIAPPDDAFDGIAVELWLTAVGADRNISFDPAISLALTHNPAPLTLSQNRTAFISMRFDGRREVWFVSQWMGAF
jgi:hypothetical protein